MDFTPFYYPSFVSFSVFECAGSLGLLLGKARDEKGSKVIGGAQSFSLYCGGDTGIESVRFWGRATALLA